MRFGSNAPCSQHLVEKVKPKTLFITHYPLIAAEFEKKVRLIYFWCARTSRSSPYSMMMLQTCMRDLRSINYQMAREHSVSYTGFPMGLLNRTALVGFNVLTNVLIQLIHHMIECARLAGLPESILSNANIQSERMRCRIEHQVASNR